MHGPIIIYSHIFIAGLCKGPKNYTHIHFTDKPRGNTNHKFPKSRGHPFPITISRWESNESSVISILGNMILQYVDLEGFGSDRYEIE